MSRSFLLILFLSFISCSEPQTNKHKPADASIQEFKSNRIAVLNLGTFHMGYTPDATTVEYDEHNQKNQQEVHQIAQMLAEFKPTVIIVETVPERNKALQKEYFEYMRNPKMKFKTPTEIELLAYELGRICNVSKIYGIDHQMDYDYLKIDSMAKSSKEPTYLTYMSNAKYRSETDFEKANTLEKLKIINQPVNLDFLIEVNADIMTHVSTENSFEGADEAAKYYQRNLRMYSNLNKLPLTEKDRVFILMGASHTAFFRDFMSRSPKYAMVNALEYLN